MTSAFEVVRSIAHITPILPTDVARLLGYGDARVSGRSRALISESIAEAHALVCPAYAYRRATREGLAASMFLAGAGVDEAVLCLVTIGAALEKRVQHYDVVGNISRALALNVCGSVAAETTADVAEAAIRGDVERGESRCSRRFSPGYGGWDGTEQRWILPYLEASALRVALTAGCMMQPRKSITFAVTVGANPREMRAENPCDDCDLTCCVYRRPTRHTEEASCNVPTYCPLGKRSE
jgi:5-methyltetrahydrofolate--homocysteine methyltransferase